MNDPAAALQRYRQHSESLHSGKVDGIERCKKLSVADLANQFLAAKDAKRRCGDLTVGAFVEYHRDCERFVGFFGKHRSVLSIARHDLAALRAHHAQGVNDVTLNSRIVTVRSICKFA